MMENTDQQKEKRLNTSYLILFNKLYYINFWCPLILEQKKLIQKVDLMFRKSSYTDFF